MSRYYIIATAVSGVVIEAYATPSIEIAKELVASEVRALPAPLQEPAVVGVILATCEVSPTLAARLFNDMSREAREGLAASKMRCET